MNLIRRDVESKNINISVNVPDVEIKFDKAQIKTNHIELTIKCNINILTEDL